MLVCISHKLGCRYFIGDFKDEQYLPEFHAMMSWNGNHFFAPESMLTRDGRRVMWAWLLNVPAAPTGLTATAAACDQIDLGWTDNADNETSFKIERSDNGVDFAQIDTGACTACGLCEERCQMAAIGVTEDDCAAINRDRCIGCGLCVTTCPTEAMQLLIVTRSSEAVDVIADAAGIAAAPTLRSAVAYVRPPGSTQ